MAVLEHENWSGERRASFGAWLAVPTRTAAEAIPEMSSRVWAVAATGTSSEPARVVAHYEALDRHGDVIARVPADPAG